MSRGLDTKPEMTNARADYYGRIDEYNMAPLWEVLHKLLAHEPVTEATPHLWNYDSLRPSLMESADVISTEEAERRVLILENPSMRGKSCITEALYAGLQLIMPGEIAATHRHSPAALRFIVEGSRAYTAIDGEKAYMEPGDLILTPSWVWHDHGHDGEVPVVWLDGLDIPDGALHGSGLCRAASRGAPCRGQSRRRQHGALRGQHAALRRAPPGREELAGLPLPLRTQPRSAARSRQVAGPRPVSRGQDGIRQPGQWRSDDADARDLHAARARGIRDRGATAPPPPGSTRWPRARGGPRSAGRHSSGGRATPSSCPPGIPTATRPTTTRSCSASPTSRSTTRSAGSASRGGTRRAGRALRYAATRLLRVRRTTKLLHPE